MFSLDLKGLDAEVRRILAACDKAAPKALARATELVTDEARAHHTFENRTGNLEASIESVPPTGVFSHGTLQGAAAAGMPYAEYVEARPGYAFMQPAADAVARQIDAEGQRIFDDALGQRLG